MMNTDIRAERRLGAAGDIFAGALVPFRRPAARVSHAFHSTVASKTDPSHAESDWNRSEVLHSVAIWSYSLLFWTPH